MSAVTIVSGAAVWYSLGRDAVVVGVLTGTGTLLDVLPKLLLGILLAGFVQVLLPRELVTRWFGPDSGLRGILLATAAGILNVGGPMTSFPLVVALARAGADYGVLIAFLTAWSLLGLQRIVIWEMSLLSGEFVLLRVLSCLALPILAGLIGRHLFGRLAEPPPTP